MALAADLVVGLAVIAALAVGLFLLAVHWAKCLPPWACNGAAVAVVAGLFFYIRHVWYDPRLAEWLPLANLIVVGNWLPFFAALIAGLVWRQNAGLPRRLVTASGLAICGALAATFPMLGSAPQCGDQWDNLGTCLQTTERTCSPACAATLLRRHGIAATEQEMAELCLTRTGTSWQGLYRGLKRKTAGTAWDVQVVTGSAEDLALLPRGPAILSVGLAQSAPANSDYTREFGWVPGVNHSVILEGFNSHGCATIADPSLPMCREQWDAETLSTLWRGYAIRLVKR